MNDSIYDIIGKHFLGTPLTIEEEKIFTNWLEQSKNREIFADIQSAWDISGKITLPKDADLDYEWNRFEKLKEERVVVKKLNLKYALAIAASVILLIGIFGIALFNMNKNIEVYTYNTEKELVLPDGSMISMNKNTSLIYNRNFGKKNRNIQLNGEAFFQVTKNQQLPFVIQTQGKIITQVLGTSFNLRGYESETLTELAVVTGRVAFGKINEVNPLVFIANQQATINRETGELNIHKFFNQNALAWRTKKLVFDNTSLNEVAETMKKFYQMEIKIPEHSIDYKFSGKFENTDPAQFATIMSATFGFTYVVTEQSILFKTTN